MVIITSVIVFLLLDFHLARKKMRNEIGLFISAVKYKDFTRYYSRDNSSDELRFLRSGFNEVNETFKALSKEKELHYQYLQNILELVDTGILSYEINTGEVLWMNESLKKLLQIPYLKAIGNLEKKNAELAAAIKQIKPGKQDIVTAYVEGNILKLLVASTMFQVNGQTYKLIAFQKVNEALNETESKAWEKLLRVMTHEIMNSVAPIASLSDTLKTRIGELSSGSPLDSNTIEDLVAGMNAISNRSAGLLKFTENYRNLNKIQHLNTEPVLVRGMFESLHQLIIPTLVQKNIKLEIVLPDIGLILHADRNLLEQMLINLLLNAMDTLAGIENASIVLYAERMHDDNILMKVADNGAGMESEVLDKIFVPFFSTKKHGSGIGLSLCKQIMTLHKGNIEVRSVVGKGTTFFCSFKDSELGLSLVD
ncbi:MAG: integral rane sensor signal transduction histidine kinase [Flavipsychrobacter sp.]|nr:integral rane sensor signal transduction histidine kinase [Flavipsychrobacter sp.]